MIVYLVRHGIAEDTAPSGLDRDRRLTERGRSRMHRIAQALRTIGIQPTTIFSSPYARAAATAEIIAQTLECPERLQFVDDLRVGGDVERCIRPLLATGGEEVMIVGHEPELSLLVGTLAGHGTAVRLKKGAICRIDLPHPDADGEIEWLLPPKVLVALSRDQAR